MTTPTLPPSPKPQTPTLLARLTSPLAGACLFVFMLLGLITTIYSLATGKLELFAKPPTLPSFIDGQVTQGIADSLAQAPVPSESARLERGVSWLAIGDLGPRVREGCPNWLFLSDELVTHPHAAENASARLQTVQQVQARLARQGAKLLVVVIPDKSRIERAQLCTLHRPEAFEHRLSDWVTQLSTAGVNVLDLTPTLATMSHTPFLRTDTHWNEHGANAAAVDVARRIDTLGVPVTPKQTYAVTSVESVRPGDLVRLAGIDWLPASVQPAVETTQISTFKAVSSPAPEALVSQTANAVGGQTAGAPAAPAVDTGDDLFGDADLPTVALIGTSFSRTSNFVPFLENALNTRLVNFSRDGGDFTGGARAYFNSPTFKETPPKLVIWEIPERVLQMPRKADDIGWAGIK